MPSLNQGRFIREAIDSILSQDFPAIEVIVMDGGSSDATLDILESYGNRIAYCSKKDKGQSEAINRGFKKASGDIFCWLNSDDLFEPAALSTVAEVFRDNPNVEFIYGKGYSINEQGEILGSSGVKPLNRWKLIHHRNFIQQPSCFFRSSLFGKVGCLREDLHYIMDWELWIRFSMYKGLFLHRYLSRNRIYPENKTVGGGFRRWNEIRRTLAEYTYKRVTPAVVLYFVEALCQVLQTKHLVGPFIAFPLQRFFIWGMEHEFSRVGYSAGKKSLLSSLDHKT
jgi:glycosyltransferase involved in cell wall biosynthesis